MKTPLASDAACLIVNADDYGYFRSVSRGILAAAQKGIVTATGILANGPHFEECVRWLREGPELDLGVHLNLTLGEPLTADMRRHLDRWSGRFPAKFTLARALLAHAIPMRAVETEWRAQIERCRDAGLSLQFINAHEHLHMFPGLYRRAHDLAAHYAIPHVRLTRPDRTPPFKPGPLLRHAILRGLAWLHQSAGDRQHAAVFLGLSESGRLDERALTRTLAGIRPGRVYELMCHPGFDDPAEIASSALRRYHDWEGEYRALTAPAVREALDARGIRLIGYRHLPQPEGPGLAGSRASHLEDDAICLSGQSSSIRSEPQTPRLP